MNDAQNRASERFSALLAALVDTPGVTPPDSGPGSRRTFGSLALKVDKKIFAMLVKDNFVVKLPRQRVEALIAAGQGLPFDAGKGRIMKEWLSVPPAMTADCKALAREAMDFVGSKS